MKLLNKNVYLDTCSYRKIAKKFLAGDFGENSLSEVMEEIKACEKRMSITVYYNALVVKELAKYLSHDKNSRGYKECSLALRILYMHAEKINSEYLLPLPDIDFFHFIFGFKTDKHKEIESNQIEYLCLLIKHDFTMNDDINTNIDRHFLSNLKESFKQAYISGFINKHSKQHSGWKLTFANEKEREPFLQKFRNRVNKYTDYAYGLLLYTLKESP